MKKVIKLRESDLARIIKLVMENETGTKSLGDTLKDTETYKFLDKNTEVRVQYGTGVDNEGGGVRFNIFPNVGKNNEYGQSYSLNNRVKYGKIKNIKDYIMENLMTESMIDEIDGIWYMDVVMLKSFPEIRRKEDIFNYLINLLVYREEVYDDYNDIVERWFFERNQTCDKIKSLPEEKVQSYIDYCNNYITHEYRYHIGRVHDEILSKITDHIKNCRS
jgi:hypothetical protein